MKKLIIVGASGHGKVVAGILEAQGDSQIVGFIDDNPPATNEFLNYPILGSVRNLIEDPHLRTHFLIIAIGDNFIRSQLVAAITKANPNAKFATCIHPRATIDPLAKIGEGTVIMAGVVVNTDCQIGNNCILNTNASIDHDSKMGMFSSLAPGVTAGGNVEIGEYTAIGIGTTILHGMKIGSHSVIGAHSLVNKKVPNNVVAYGLPARMVRTRKDSDPYL